MQYNLLESSYIYSNTESNITLDVEEIEVLISLRDFATTSGVVTISGTDGGTDTLGIDADLGDRITIDQMRYYFNSAAVSGTVASGISFYYKDEEADSYSGLTTNVGDGYYYTTVPSLSAPRYVRIVHAMSGTNIIGDVIAWTVLNDDTVVDFGSDGALETTHVMTTTDYLGYDDYIKEIEIFNSGAQLANARVMIDPQYSDIDVLISISTSEDGPWVFARNTDLTIVDGDSWDTGRYSDTNSDTESKLRLDGTKTTGTYTTAIFKKDTDKLVHLDVNAEESADYMLSVDAEDYTSTVEMREHPTPPLSYIIYRKMDATDGRNNYIDFLVETDTDVYNMYIDDGCYFGNPACELEEVYDFTSNYGTTMTIDDVGTLKTFIIMYTRTGHGYYGSSYHRTYLMVTDGSGPWKHKTIQWRQIAYRDTSNGNVGRYDPQVFFIKPHYNGALWVYVRIQGDPSSGDMADEGYYLARYGSGVGTPSYKQYSASNFILDADVTYNSSTLWYIPIGGTAGVYRLSYVGDLLSSYTGTYTTDLKSVTSTLVDSGCWFGNQDSLYRLDSSSNLIDSMEGIATVDLGLIAVDPFDNTSFYIMDGSYLRRIFSDGRIDWSINLELIPQQLIAKPSGIWLLCNRWTDAGLAKYVGRMSGSIEKEMDFNPTWTPGTAEKNYYVPGFSEVAYDNPTNGDAIPLVDDPVWDSSLEWRKVNPDTYVLPREEYQQLRLTLRRPNTSLDLPTVDNVYMQDSVLVPNIYPGQSETLYLKVSLPTGVSAGGDYSSMLRVWWEHPV